MTSWYVTIEQHSILKRTLELQRELICTPNKFITASGFPLSLFLSISLFDLAVGRLQLQFSLTQFSCNEVLGYIVSYFDVIVTWCVKMAVHDVFNNVAGSNIFYSLYSKLLLAAWLLTNNSSWAIKNSRLSCDVKNYLQFYIFWMLEKHGWSNLFYGNQLLQY